MQTFHFDLSTKSIAPVLNVKQGDVGRKFKAVITDGGVAYNIPAGAQFSVWFSGPSGEGNYSAIGERTAFAVDGNTVTVELIAQMLVNAGTGAMCLVLYGNDGTQLGLWNVIYAVEHVPGMGSEAAEDYYTALSELAKHAIDAAATFETDPSLSVGGRAADAAAVGAQLETKAPAGYIDSYYEAATETAIDTELKRLCDTLVKATKQYRMLAHIGGNTTNFSAGVWVFEFSRSYYSYLITATNGSNTLTRTYDGTTLGVWEHENPPMVLGVEYRTTKRWQGATVYTKQVYFGYLPNGSTSTVGHGIGGFTHLVDISIASNKKYDSIEHNSGISQIVVNTTDIAVVTNTNLSGYNAYFTLEYVKS